jgi:hypothetical protein
MIPNYPTRLWSRSGSSKAARRPLHSHMISPVRYTTRHYSSQPTRLQDFGPELPQRYGAQDQRQAEPLQKLNPTRPATYSDFRPDKTAQYRIAHTGEHRAPTGTRTHKKQRTKGYDYDHTSYAAQGPHQPTAFAVAGCRPPRRCMASHGHTHARTFMDFKATHTHT